ncbi:leucyl aminopeptidase family protein [Oscillatoria sp. CS-180]|uniref:leucyl aminopeptidase family protein n=1 Tax=Oscillatoria sp. CS-180 TaxID=3021720 RepID=UPI00232ACC74|nr:leucyl aminopeptidase family protein [Oscillatoria sp. CS-180]MDB9526236.1 leucyl aminopeptidase family protein [Oscillatoria sp. CS-180]
MSTSTPIPILLVTAEQLKTTFAEEIVWIDAMGFRAEPGTFCLLPDPNKGVAKVLVGRPEILDTWVLGGLSKNLPVSKYAIANPLTPDEATALTLGWKLGQYQFNRYKKNQSGAIAELVPPDNADIAYVDAVVEATSLARDLINTPANDMGPDNLEEAAQILAVTYDADLKVTTGKTLEAENYPMIYAVGKASETAPRLIDLRWGDVDAPKVTLVGKGVCFDSGGLDLKPAKGMLMMKKDMGGAAHVLGVATLIMKLDIPVRLRVLIPAVENSVSGNAMRPLDVIPTRKGITVEVGNTDAEGRLVLADALSEASNDNPDLLVDFATLTGAARVALGTELPAFFCNRSDLIQSFESAMNQADDPLWNLPLHSPYRDLLNSKIADISNISSGSYGGAITAALFLQEFIKPEIPWIHIDVMAWNLRLLPGRPEGGEAMGMRSIFELIRQQFTKAASS